MVVKLIKSGAQDTDRRVVSQGQGRSCENYQYTGKNYEKSCENHQYTEFIWNLKFQGTIHYQKKMF